MQTVAAVSSCRNVTVGSEVQGSVGVCNKGALEQREEDVFSRKLTRSGASVMQEPELGRAMQGCQTRENLGLVSNISFLMCLELLHLLDVRHIVFYLK